MHFDCFNLHCLLDTQGLLQLQSRVWSARFSVSVACKTFIVFFVPTVLGESPYLLILQGRFPTSFFRLVLEKFKNKDS